MKPSLQRNPKYQQGIFKPRNPEKYIGDEIPVFRSSIEYNFMKFCDMNPNVIKWGSENIQVPYFDTVTKKHRKYFVDNIVHIQEGDKTNTYIIELKDKKETEKPKHHPRKKKSTLLYEEVRHENNVCKWKAAKEYARVRGVQFLLLGYTKKDGFFKADLDSLLINI